MRSSKFLSRIFYCPDRDTFCFPFIYNGAKCKVVGAYDYTIKVLFGEETKPCIVSPSYLITSKEWERIQRKNTARKELKMKAITNNNKN